MSFAVTMRLRDVEAAIRAQNGGYRQLSVDERAVMDAYGIAIRNAVADQWPVDTSQSRDNFDYNILDTAAFLGIELVNDLDYAQYVHRKGTPPEPPLWQTLIPEVWAEYKPMFVVAMLGAVADTQRRIEESKAAGGRGWLDVVSRRYRPAVEVGAPRG